MGTDRERLINPLILRRRLHVCFRVMIGARIDESGRFLNLEDHEPPAAKLGVDWFASGSHDPVNIFPLSLKFNICQEIYHGEIE